CGLRLPPDLRCRSKRKRRFTMDLSCLEGPKGQGGWSTHLRDRTSSARGTDITPNRSRETSPSEDPTMWLFTKHGFYSAVCARTGDGRHGQPPDVTRIMVRARVKEHLNGLKDRFPDLLGP